MSMLDDLTDVDTTGRVAGDKLTYDAGAGLWKPVSGVPPFADATVTFNYGTTWRQQTELAPPVRAQVTANASTPPSTPTYQFTVTPDDLTAVTGFPAAFVYQNDLMVVISGRRTSSAGNFLSAHARVRVNGVIVLGPIAIGGYSMPSEFLTVTIPVRGVQVDDVVSVEVWHTQTGVEWDVDFTARAPMTSRLFVVPDDAPYLIVSPTEPTVVVPPIPTLTPAAGGAWMASNSPSYIMQSRAVVFGSFVLSPARYMVTGPGTRCYAPDRLQVSAKDGHAHTSPSDRQAWTNSRLATYAFRYAALSSTIDD
jgi:hypothetical protein